MNMFVVPEEKKQEYWQYFVVTYKPHPVGFTQRRLEKARPHIWNDPVFWEDIIFRHGGQSRSPVQMKEQDPETYEHCMGNIAGMLVHTMHRHGILK